MDVNKAYHQPHPNDPGYDYGEVILDANNSIKKRFVNALDEGINAEEKTINSEGENFINALKDVANALISGDSKAIEKSESAAFSALEKSKAAQKNVTNCKKLNPK